MGRGVEWEEVREGSQESPHKAFCCHCQFPLSPPGLGRPGRSRATATGAPPALLSYLQTILQTVGSLYSQESTRATLGLQHLLRSVVTESSGPLTSVHV